jgi:hypothetical protein
VLAVHDNSVEYETAAPVPVNEIVVGEFEALLAIVRLPLTLPVAAGANVTFTVIPWPAAMICPLETPLSVKPPPAMLTLETVALEPPVFVRVVESAVLPPTSTLPKLRLDELRLKVPGVDVTVSVAAALVALPTKFETVTTNCDPFSELVVAGVV